MFGGITGVEGKFLQIFQEASAVLVIPGGGPNPGAVLLEILVEHLHVQFPQVLTGHRGQGDGKLAILAAFEKMNFHGSVRAGKLITTCGIVFLYDFQMHLGKHFLQGCSIMAAAALLVHEDL